MTELPFQLPELIPTLRGVAAVALGIWLLLALDRRRWWPSDWSLHLDSAAREIRPGQFDELVVVVPARNEAATIPRTLPRLLKQHEWFRRIVVVDDRSADRTEAAARRLGQGTPAEHKLEVVRIEERSEGWSGKVRALQRGLEEAIRDWDGDPDRQWVLFTDADVLHPTSSLPRLLYKAEQGDYDLVSVMAVLRADSLVAHLLIPAYLYFFQLLYPFRKASDPASRTAAAAGGCVLVRRSVLEEIDGFERIADRIIDDLALAREAKSAGARCWLGLDPDLSSIRVYGSFGDIVALVARTAFEQLGRRYSLVPVVWAGLTLMFVAPPLLAVAGAALGDPWIAGAALAALIIQIAHYLPVVQYVDVPSVYAGTLPIAALAYGWMTWLSAWRQLTGKRIPWRENIENDGTR